MQSLCRHKCSNNVITHQDDNKCNVQHEKENVSALSINWHMLAVPTLCRLWKAKKRKIVIAFMESATGVLEEWGRQLAFWSLHCEVNIFVIVALNKEERGSPTSSVLWPWQREFRPLRVIGFSRKCSNLKVGWVIKLWKKQENLISNEILMTFFRFSLWKKFFFS